MTNARPGYWDIERCEWVGVEPTHVVPPMSVPPVSAPPVPDPPVDDSVPAPRSGPETASGSTPVTPVAAESAAG